MYESFKNNIFLKSILVFVIGVFIFDIFFGFITGSENYYSFKGLINGMLVFLIKLLILLFLIIVIAVLTKWLKEIFVKNINTESFLRVINTPVLKISIVIAAILIISTFMFGLLSSLTVMNNNINMGGMSAGYYSGVNFGVNTASLMGLLVKILMSILIFTLIFGAFMYLKEQNENQNIKSKTNNNSDLNSVISSQNNKND